MKEAFFTEPTKLKTMPCLLAGWGLALLHGKAHEKQQSTSVRWVRSSVAERQVGCPCGPEHCQPQDLIM